MCKIKGGVGNGEGEAIRRDKKGWRVEEPLYMSS